MKDEFRDFQGSVAHAMRAHCINVYGARDAHLGDIWLTAPEPLAVNRRLILHPDMSGAVSLSPSNVRDLRDACDAFLTDLESRTR